MIAVIDYGMGNLASVKKALDYIGEEAVITSDKEVVSNADAVILPGVGAISFAMKALEEKGLDIAVKDFVKSGKPFMGICLGMQMLFDESEETLDGGENVRGLGIIPGKVLKFPSDKTVQKGLKVPQIGWNSLEDVKGELLKEGDFVYFVHSYYCCPVNSDDAAAYAEYGIKYCCSIEHGNIYACQFHPEKSGEAGLNILRKFAGRIDR